MRSLGVGLTETMIGQGLIEREGEVVLLIAKGEGRVTPEGKAGLRRALALDVESL